MDVITSVDVLYTTLDGYYEKDYLESVLRSKDFDMILTSRECIIQRSISFVESLDDQTQVIYLFTKMIIILSQCQMKMLFH